MYKRQLFTEGAAEFGLRGEAISAGRRELSRLLDEGSIVVASMLPGEDVYKRQVREGAISFMSKSITQDMAYRLSLMKYAEKYGVSLSLIHI